MRNSLIGKQLGLNRSLKFQMNHHYACLYSSLNFSCVIKDFKDRYSLCFESKLAVTVWVQINDQLKIYKSLHTGTLEHFKSSFWMMNQAIFSQPLLKWAILLTEHVLYCTVNAKNIEKDRIRCK